MTVIELADALGVHANTVRFHLDALRRQGQLEDVEVGTAGRPGRPAARVRAARGMDPGGVRQYRELAGALTSGLAHVPDSAELARRAGRDWASRLRPSSPAPADPVGRLGTLLDELGFAPEPPAADRVRLRHCPFLELARSAESIVCSVHLGLMQGLLDEAGSEFTVDRLEPFVEPDLCLARLSRKATR